MKKALLTAAFSGLSMLACAQGTDAGKAAAAQQAAEAPPSEGTSPAVAPGSADERAVAAVRGLNSQLHIDHVGAAPLPGFREVIVAGQTLYVSDDGSYMLQGNLFDMVNKRDLSQVSIGNMRKRLLAEVPAAERIVFAPENPQYRVTVFTDVECGYCRRLHNEIAEYNRLGIAVEYLAFPRSGPAGEDFKIMENVWCSNNRNRALTDAKNGRMPQAVRCTNPVMRHYLLGQRLGLQGTPMIIAENGVNTPGYMPPAQLKQWLDAQAVR